MDIFKACQIINDHIPLDEEKAREKLIKLLDHCKSKKIPYNELINHLIRRFVASFWFHRLMQLLEQ
jgi:hypothetical protein